MLKSRGRRLRPPLSSKLKRMMANTTGIYVRLRAAGYSIADAARLLGLSLVKAWEIEAHEKHEIELEAGLLELKRIANKK